MDMRPYDWVSMTIVAILTVLAVIWFAVLAPLSHRIDRLDHQLTRIEQTQENTP